MKHYGFVFVSLVMLFCVCLPLSAQPNANSVETFLIDDFDVPEAVDFSWGVQASKSVYVNEEEGEVYPNMGYQVGIPNSLLVYRNEEDPEAQVLGIEIKFDRKGDNWFEVYPQKADQNGEMIPYEVPLRGDVAHLDFWAWGANYLYYLDVLVRDADGRVHVLPTGNLAYDGWKNIVINIPGWMLQQSHLRSGPKNLSFVGFRVRSDPVEYVDNFRIFFDQIRYSSYTMSDVYDGYFLSDIDFGNADTAAEGGTN